MTEAEANKLVETFLDENIPVEEHMTMRPVVHALLLSATRPAPGYIRTSEGQDMRLLGTLPTTKDGCVVGDRATIYGLWSDGRPGWTGESSVYVDGDDWDKVPGGAYSTLEASRTAAEAAKREGEHGS